MMPTEGLISSYAGQMVLAFILLGFGSVFAVVLTVAAFLRNGLPLTTQTDRQTGIKQHGVGRWFVVCAMFTCGLQVLFIGVRSLIHLGAWIAYELTPLWWVGLLVMGLGLIAGMVWWLSRPRVDPYPRVELPPPLVTPLASRPEPLGWSLPADAPQWDER